jgi:hypothetical protein
MGLDLREARLHLGVGLDLDFAQLVAQADDVFGEVEQGAAQGAQFALDAGAGDADLAGFVDELVDAAGFDPQLGAGGLGGDVAGLGRGGFFDGNRGVDAGGGRGGWAASGMPRLSRVWRVWSRAVSSSSMISRPASPWWRARSRRVSRSWMLWPRLIAPTIRALPLRVCSRRAMLAGWAASSGAVRQLCSAVPSWSRSSLPSSRKIGSRSVSSSSRSWGAAGAGPARAAGVAAGALRAG